MKILLILMTAFLMQVSASTFAQKITLNEKEASLVSIFEKINKQSGVDFLVDIELLSKAKPVNINVNNEELVVVLDKIFKGQPLEYSIKDKAVVVTKKKPSFLERVADRWAAIDVHGRVVDQEGKPLPGATVKVKGTGKSVSTNGKGEFYLEKVEEDEILLISFIGYVNKEVIARKDIGDVVLEIATGQLEEQVIKGYYTTTKELNTGSVGTLKAVDIEKQPVSDPLMALEGRIPGLYVSQTSGVPGAPLNVSLRGRNSINNGTNPLYVIDGIPYDSKPLTQASSAAGGLSPFAAIRPSDIERIDVLKDADATAIYGSRGANGVVLITTKKGKVGKTNVNINVYNGAGKIASKLEQLNTQQYLEMRNEAFKNDNATPQAYEYDINGIWDKNRYTDWQKVLIGGTSKMTDVNGSMSGGNTQTQFLLSLGHRRESTIYPGDYLNVISSGNLNVNHESENRKFNAKISVNYSNNNNRLPIIDFTSLIRMAPNAPAIYDTEGNINWENNTFDNPFASTLRKNTTIADNLISNLSMHYNLTKDLQLKNSLAYSLSRVNEQMLIPYTSWMPSSVLPIYGRQNITANNNSRSWIIEPQLNYRKNFEDHHVDALLGTTFNESTQNGSVINASGFGSDALIENVSAAMISKGSTTYGQYRYNAIYFRLGYNFKEKYVLNLTGRRDGSSRFGPGKQFGNFGSLGAAWLFSKEEFIKNLIPALSLGKFRGSIGRTGNDQFSDYQFLSTFSPYYAYFETAGLQPDKLSNSNYRWETINKIEGALELGFFNNRLLFNTIFYRNRTSNQLVGYSLPATSGFSSIIANLPAVIQNKGLEFELSGSIIDRKRFSWESTFNLTIPRNKLVSYPNIEGSSYRNIYAVGYPLNILYLYHYTGLNKETGLYTFEDFDKNGSIDYSTDRRPVFLGQKSYGGLSNTFRYKGLSLDIFMQFVKQTGFDYVSSGSPGIYYVFTGNQPTKVLDRWRQSGDNATYQRFTSVYGLATSLNDKYLYSDAQISDASFIRLKNVMLAWQLPNQWIDKIKMKSARLYLQGQNLLTISKFKGMDPENQKNTSSPALPPLRVITCGMQVNL